MPGYGHQERLGGSGEFAFYQAPFLPPACGRWAACRGLNPPPRTALWVFATGFTCVTNTGLCACLSTSAPQGFSQTCFPLDDLTVDSPPPISESKVLSKKTSWGEFPSNILRIPQVESREHVNPPVDTHDDVYCDHFFNTTHLSKSTSPDDGRGDFGMSQLWIIKSTINTPQSTIHNEYPLGTIKFAPSHVPRLYHRKNLKGKVVETGIRNFRELPCACEVALQRNLHMPVWGYSCLKMKTSPKSESQFATAYF